LLKQSLKCPLSVQQIKKWGGVATYTGDAHAYRVDSKYVYNVESEYAYPTGGEPHLITTARISDFASVSLGGVNNDYINVSCKGNKHCFQTITVSSNLDYKSVDNGSVDYYLLCDSETAANVKAALDTLIRMNRK